MRLDLALLADAATVDGSGKLNILGIFDHIAAASFPARHEHMCLVMRFSAAASDAGEHQVLVAVRDPEEEELARMSGSLDLGPSGGVEGVRIPHVLWLNGFVFPQPGVYAVEISIDGEVAGTLSLRLSRAPRIPQA
ncbi:MAG: hypothetical protein RQ751_08140 [Longimicrobiales bacterium]|nr:hypothetical protein [Longimicrobiales bacterium]